MQTDTGIHRFAEEFLGALGVDLHLENVTHNNDYEKKLLSVCLDRIFDILYCQDDESGDKVPLYLTYVTNSTSFTNRTFRAYGVEWKDEKIMFLEELYKDGGCVYYYYDLKNIRIANNEERIEAIQRDNEEFR